jgi:hypothetical protein
METTKDNLPTIIYVDTISVPEISSNGRRNETVQKSILMVHISEVYVYFANQFQVHYFIVINE